MAQRTGWDVVAGFLILFFAIGAKVPAGPKRPPFVGDPGAFWVGLSFVLVGCACVIAPRAEESFSPLSTAERE
jgi:hypothetical protein